MRDCDTAGAAAATGRLWSNDNVGGHADPPPPDRRGRDGARWATGWVGAIRPDIAGKGTIFSPKKKHRRGEILLLWFKGIKETAVKQGNTAQISVDLQPREAPAEGAAHFFLSILASMKE